jgi:hypothetical protein
MTLIDHHIKIQHRGWSLVQSTVLWHAKQENGSLSHTSLAGCGATCSYIATNPSFSIVFLSCPSFQVIHCFLINQPRSETSKQNQQSQEVLHNSSPPVLKMAPLTRKRKVVDDGAQIRQKKTASKGKAVQDFHDNGSYIIQSFKLSVYHPSNSTL